MIRRRSIFAGGLLACAVLTLAAGLELDAAAQPFVGPPPPACVAPNKVTQADSLLVTKTFAEKNALKVGSRMPMRTMQGDLVFTVRGIMKPGGLASAFGGDLAIMDIYAAQKFFGRGRKFDRG